MSFHKINELHDADLRRKRAFAGNGRSPWKRAKPPRRPFLLVLLLLLLVPPRTASAQGGDLQDPALGQDLDTSGYQCPSGHQLLWALSASLGGCGDALPVRLAIKSYRR
jgi:membrane-associated phospholipid phosphatase|eukprot:COSAG01_NODE_9574_length_2405_cov_2.574154_1_plen_109_part_00